MKGIQIQHGDVLLKPVERLPKGVIQHKNNGRLVVAEGEATGHAHVITDLGAVLWELKGDLYLEVAEIVTITHEEHKPLEIPEGIYQIGRVQEYDYFQEMARRVID